MTLALGSRFAHPDLPAAALALGERFAADSILDDDRDERSEA
jgi:hypothetical protein